MCMHERELQEPPGHTSEHVKTQNFLGAFPQTPLIQSIFVGPHFLYLLWAPPILSAALHSLHTQSYSQNAILTLESSLGTRLSPSHSSVVLIIATCTKLCVHCLCPIMSLKCLKVIVGYRFKAFDHLIHDVLKDEIVAMSFQCLRSLQPLVFGHPEFILPS